MIGPQSQIHQPPRPGGVAGGKGDRRFVARIKGDTSAVRRRPESAPEQEDAATAAQRQITALEQRLGGGTTAAAAEPPRHTSVQFANGEQQLATIHSAEELPPPQAGAGATGRKFSANV